MHISTQYAHTMQYNPYKVIEFIDNFICYNRAFEVGNVYVIFLYWRSVVVVLNPADVEVT